MKLILKYKETIVSFGLLPTIITLAGLHFFPATVILGLGLFISILALFYAIFRIKELNFFLLQGSISIGICLLLRLLTGYRFLPEQTITPTLEFMLLIFAFLHITAPEIYQNFLHKLHLNTCFSYTLEAKIIVLLSSIHLLCIGAMKYEFSPIPHEYQFLLIYVPPFAIYLFCLLFNIIGIHFAIKETPFRYSLLRIAPVFQGKIYLIPRQGSSQEEVYWDLPIEGLFEGAILKSEAQAYKLTQNYLNTRRSLRLRFLLHYKKIQECGCIQQIRLYILPLYQEQAECCTGGKFISFEEMKQKPDAYNAMLIKEATSLQMAAEMWEKYESDKTE